jgi:hypothetical protein
MKKFEIFIFATILATTYFLSLANAAEPIIITSFSVNPSVIAPGNEGYIQLTLKNTGSAAANRIKISRVSFDQGIIPYGQWIIDLGALGIGDSSIALFKFAISSDASAGLYTINFNIDYCEDSSCRTIAPNVIINVQSPSNLELLSINPSSLKPGEKTNLTFTIMNKGNSISNVIFSWSSARSEIFPLGSGNRIVIPAIDENSYYNIKTEVLVSSNALPGISPLIISIQYQDKSGANQTISLTAGIEISGETDFDISVQESSATLTTLAIANIGTTTAYSTIVRIPQQENFRVIGASSSVIGNLNAGDYTLASFQIVPAGNFTRRKLNVEISYTDSTGIRRIIQKEVELSFLNATQIGTIIGRTRTQTRFQISTSTQYIIIGVAGIACIIAFLKIRKWKRK